MNDFASAESQIRMPSPQMRQQMVMDLEQHISRIDGDGLLPRNNRPESWENTIRRLSDESAKVETLFDLGRVFKRFDATYPNLHANVFMIPQLDENKSVGKVSLPFKFYAEIVDRQIHANKYFIVVDGQQQGSLRNGDELISINSIPIQNLSDENFIFCKFPLRQQCEIEFFDNFRNELLGWNRHQPLELQVRRGTELLTVQQVPVVKSNTDNRESDAQKVPCGVRADRYKGFSIAYEGQNLCAFESKKDSQIVVIRISSFQYQDVPFAVLDGEVQIFWNNYWSKKSPKIKTLILDVIGNWGGQSPIPYYGLFYSKPYQEQYVRFKKIKEFERKEILESLFWGDKSKEIWFENIKKEGSFDRTLLGNFLDQIPQFCADSKKDCREGLFVPRRNGFTGKVKLMMDHWCISSCVGFVSNIKDLLKDRVKTFGVPDSGDSAYSRLTILITPHANRVESAVVSMKKARTPDKPEAWVRQVAAVTLTTDREGVVLSGKPQNIDVWVPRHWSQTDDDWAATVFNAVVRAP